MRATLLLFAIQNDCHFTLKIEAELIEPAFDADRSDWKIVERGIVNPFDSAIPGCNVSGRECPFRFHPPGDQYSQPQTNSFVVVIVLDNRLVAAELERRWEESLRALREAEDSM